MEQLAHDINNSSVKQNEFYTSENKYIIGHVEKFDQKYTVYNRARWDPSVMELAEGIYGILPPRNKEGYSLIDRALQNSFWYVEMAFAHGHVRHGKDLYAWKKKPYSDCIRLPADLKLKITDPIEMARRVKKVAKLLGADLVGICKLDSRWVYSHWFDLITRESGPLEIPEGCRYAVALAIEMDYKMFRTSPTEIMGAATGLGYSKMAFVAGSLAHFIRNLGYSALACGNDTGLSVPIAIDAGLGELGRHGLLITPKFGPRVRIAKVLTDLPLTPDKPNEFGVAQFCEICRKCAKNCPSQAIQYAERSDKALNTSTSPGVLKWPVNGERCFSYWSRNHSGCGNCVRVCPFNKPDTWFHRVVKWHVKNFKYFDRFYKWMDDVCGYGKQTGAEEWWNREQNLRANC